MNKTFVISLACVFLLSACASNSKTVPRGASYRTLDFGSVIHKEPVTLGGTHSGIGAYIVSAAAIHDSTSNSFLGYVVRGLAGAFVGAFAEEAITRRPGVLYTIETARGGLIEVASANQELTSGDCVQISHAGRRHTEISPAAMHNCTSAVAPKKRVPSSINL